ncbi:MAG: hypothetical protein KME32_12615 [Mojavia pulchra JT2-VF2]|jgi:hypothetical protein|uniref:Uncharacterized protein n=1 Tax=Mojavia pulchra JT2-VF2 TaxID=287848 RepID=A0A951PZS9_9NOST|nr:hypothetical protein [Mojavia pulchra JT2-VF2]
MAMLGSKPLGVFAQENTESLEIKIHDDSKRCNQGSLWKFVRLGGTSIQRFLWHGKAYGTISGIMLLTLMSMIFLGVHWSYRKLLPAFTTSKNTPKSTSD